MIETSSTSRQIPNAIKTNHFRDSVDVLYKQDMEITNYGKLSSKSILNQAKINYLTNVRLTKRKKEEYFYETILCLNKLIDLINYIILK